MGGAQGGGDGGVCEGLKPGRVRSDCAVVLSCLFCLYIHRSDMFSCNRQHFVRLDIEVGDEGMIMLVSALPVVPNSLEFMSTVG